MLSALVTTLVAFSLATVPTVPAVPVVPLRRRLQRSSRPAAVGLAGLTYKGGVGALGFCDAPHRMYPISRVVAAPQDMNQILEICCDLVLGAIRNGGGNVLVFLPGMWEIQRLRSEDSILSKRR